MKDLSGTGMSVIAGICLLLGAGTLTTHSIAGKTVQKETLNATHASGTFEVKLTPQDDKSEDTTRGRLLIAKQFHGDLEATGNGQMLTAGTSIKDSGGYVAIEKVSGTLHGRHGSFVFQHSGTMTRGQPQLLVTVVPDSGTDQLAGLTGRMTIKIADGKHYYEFEYTLAKTN